MVEVGRGVTAARAMCDTRLATTNLSTLGKQTPALSSPRAADPTPKGRGSSGMFSAPSPRLCVYYCRAYYKAVRVGGGG